MNGQVELTQHEQRRLPLGNQYTSRETKPIMCWQAVKAAAIKYGVTDWTAKIDSALTYEENIELMRKSATNIKQGGPTVKELRGREVIRTGGCR